MLNKFLEHKYIGISGIIAGTIAIIGDAFSYSFLYILAAVTYILGIGLGIYDIKKEEKFYKSNEIHLPIVINVDSPKSSLHIYKQLLKKIENEIGVKNYEEGLKKYLNIVRENLIYEYGVGLENIYNHNKLISFLQIISYNINKIQKKLDNKIIFHIAYYSRPAIAFALGIVFENDDVVVYQNNPDKDYFDEVARSENRNYKRNVKEFEKFEVIRNENGEDEILLVINTSSHKVNINAPSLKKFKNKILLNAKHDGTISLDEDWMQYVREIFTVLNDLQTKYSQIVIAHAMPESIAFLVGMSMGSYWNVKITQYDSNTQDYKDVYSMKDIKIYF